MTPEDERRQSSEAVTALNRAVGECIAAWASVEIAMGILFCMAANVRAEVADALFEPVRSFAARGAMIHNVMRLSLSGKPLLDDWNLLYAHLKILSGKRNEIAHSATLTRLRDDKVYAVLEPYFVLSRTKDTIEQSEIAERAEEFQELTDAFNWFSAHLVPSGQQIASFLPPPDLLLRLRAQEVEKREEQRRRAQSSDRR